MLCGVRHGVISGADMFESGAPTVQPGACKAQFTAKEEITETSANNDEKNSTEEIENPQGSGKTRVARSSPEEDATARETLLYDTFTVGGVSVTKVTADEIAADKVITDHRKCQDLSDIGARNQDLSNDLSREYIVETCCETQLDESRSLHESNELSPQYLPQSEITSGFSDEKEPIHSEGDSEAKTIPHISTEVSSPNSKRLKLDFVNVLQPGCMVESSSYIDSGPSEERRGDGSSLSVSHDYDNSNQDTAAELGNTEAEAVLLPTVDKCAESPAVSTDAHIQTQQVQLKSPEDSDSSGLTIQVFPQNISLVSGSQVLTTDVAGFSSQVPAILTEGDAEESDSQSQGHFPAIPSSPVIITADTSLGPHLTSTGDTVTIVTPDSSCTTTATLSVITHSTPEVRTVANEPLTVMPSADYHHGIVLTDQQSLLLSGIMVPEGVVNDSTLQINLPCSQAMTTEGVQVICSDGDDQKLLLCPHPECNKVCSKAYKLKLHLLSHTGERPHKCPQKGCEWAFTTAYKLKRHVRGHTGERPFACTYDGCSKRFTTAYNLKTHLQAHFKSNTIVCSYEGCDKTFPSAHKLRVHERKHQLEQKPYRCEVEGCGKEFTVMGTLTSHIKSHSSERPHACPVEGCEKRFTKASKLKLHVRTHTGERPFVCSFEHCNWSFTSAYKLKRHMRKHTGERPFICKYEDCGKSFTRSSHLKTHTLVHTGEKPYACPVDGCGKAFTAGSSLNVHMRKHTGEKPFKCEADGCSKAYTTAANLRAHQKRHEIHKKPLDQDGSETGSSQLEFVDIHPMSSASTVHSAGVPEVAYNSIHSFSSDDFHPDDVTSLSAVGVHLLTSSIETSSSSQLTFSSIGHHSHMGQGVDEEHEVGGHDSSEEPEAESAHIRGFQSGVENREQLEGMEDDTQVDVAEFIVRADDDATGVLERSPGAGQEHNSQGAGTDPTKHDVFDLPTMASMLGHLSGGGANKHGEHHSERKRRKTSSGGSGRRRSLDYRTAVHPEDQFAPPAVIFQDEIIKSGSSDVEGEGEGISSHMQRSPEVPMTPTPRQSLSHINLVHDPLQVHLSHSLEQEVTSSHETVIDIDPEVSAAHPIAASEIPFDSHLASIHEGEGISKGGLSCYMDTHSSSEQEETNGDSYHESTINLQDLR